MLSKCKSVQPLWRIVWKFLKKKKKLKIESSWKVSNYFQPHELYPARLLCLWKSPGKNIALGSHFLLQGIFPTQGLNLSLLHCRQVLYIWATRKLSYDTKTPVLSIYLEKTLIWKDTCTSMFIAALFTLAKIRKLPKCPLTSEWIKKTWYIYTMEYYSTI